MTLPTLPASIPVSLRRLFPDASFVGRAEIAVTAATDRSGECAPGCLFAVLPGTKSHGREFVAEAVRRGAASLLTEAPLPDALVPQCIVRDTRAAYSSLCHALFGSPSRRLGVVGVTGTNGKTSTTWLVRSILATAGRRTGLLGTIEYHDGARSVPASLTTPDPRTLAAWTAATLSNGGRHLALELSSHALHQGRAAGLCLDVAVITNITRDHFDYHGNHESYRDAKGRIAGLLKGGGRLVLNADDPGSLSLADRTPARGQLVTFGIEQPADVTASQIRETDLGTEFLLSAGAERATARTPLIGRHNVSNCLAAAAAALHFGVSLRDVAAGIENLAQIPGRLERIDAGQPFQVFVDYAHTDDALQRVIDAVRRVTEGRVLCVFGAGGDRDRTKRSPMGTAASRADLLIVTSDNPRGEDPQAIIYDILAGCTSAAVHVDPDRERAIAWALQQARPGDAVIVAGKGHERVQIVDSQRLPFDDAEVCRRHLGMSYPLSHVRRELQTA
jgi:UDP-N-acetylmuramoyl-L-alanyl-D-glutamate--2,6-diaminopimelate ligase